MFVQEGVKATLSTSTRSSTMAAQAGVPPLTIHRCVLRASRFHCWSRGASKMPCPHNVGHIHLIVPHKKKTWTFDMQSELQPSFKLMYVWLPKKLMQSIKKWKKKKMQYWYVCVVLCVRQYQELCEGSTENKGHYRVSAHHSPMSALMYSFRAEHVIVPSVNQFSVSFRQICQISVTLAHVEWNPVVNRGLW